uniref:Uncharacterized protein n=1 Tax=Eutreptiella gymnastica TaxID=73025 RepID=A0A7S4D1V2_9EUGL
MPDTIGSMPCSGVSLESTPSAIPQGCHAAPGACHPTPDQWSSPRAQGALRRCTVSTAQATLTAGGQLAMDRRDQVAPSSEVWCGQGELTCRGHGGAKAHPPGGPAAAPEGDQPRTLTPKWAVSERIIFFCFQ